MTMCDSIQDNFEYVNEQKFLVNKTKQKEAKHDEIYLSGMIDVPERSIDSTTYEHNMAMAEQNAKSSRCHDTKETLEKHTVTTKEVPVKRSIKINGVSKRRGSYASLMKQLSKSFNEEDFDFDSD